MERIRLPAKLESLGGFRQFVERWAMAAGATPQLLAKIGLVLEELLVNQARHAYGGSEGLTEVACFCRADGRFCLEVSDEAPAFDPLRQTTPDLTLAAEARPVGGLGIHLIRSLADEVAYRRASGRNVFTACFALPRKETLG